MRRTSSLVAAVGLAVAALTALTANPADAVPLGVDSGRLTGVPKHSAHVAVHTGAKTEVQVDFRAGAAIRGQVSVAGATGRDLSGLPVALVTTGDVVLTVTHTDEQGRWTVGGLAPATRSVRVCVSGALTASLHRPTSQDSYGSRCLGSSTDWTPSRDLDAYPSPVSLPGVPSTATRYSLTLGRTTDTGTVRLPALGSVQVRTTQSDASVAPTVFDAAGHAVGVVHGSFVTGLRPGSYRVCAIVTHDSSDRTDPGYGPTCAGGSAWPGAVPGRHYAAAQYPPPASDTSTITVTAGATTQVTIDAIAGAAVTGTVTVGPNTPDTMINTTVALYGDGRLASTTTIDSYTGAFGFTGLPARTDWVVCAKNRYAAQGECWKTHAFDTSPEWPATPPTQADAIATTSGAATVVDLDVPGTHSQQVLLSGFTREPDGTPVIRTDVRVYRYDGPQSLVQIAFTQSHGKGDWSATVAPGLRVVVCFDGHEAHRLHRAPPAGTYVYTCYQGGSPFLVHAPGQGSQPGIDATMQRGGAVITTVTAGGTRWGATVFVARPDNGQVLPNDVGYTYPNEGRAVVSGVRPSTSGYLVCFTPSDEFGVSRLHPTGLLPQCVSGRDWYGRVLLPPLIVTWTQLGATAG